MSVNIAEYLQRWRPRPVESRTLWGLLDAVAFQCGLPNLDGLLMQDLRSAMAARGFVPVFSERDGTWRLVP